MPRLVTTGTAPWSWQSDNGRRLWREVKYTGGSSDDGKETDACTGYAVGASQMYFPSSPMHPISIRSSPFRTLEDTAVTVQMTYTNRDGTVDFPPIGTNIPALGSKSFAMNTPARTVC